MPLPLKKAYFILLLFSTLHLVAQQQKDSLPVKNVLNEVIISSFHINDSLLHAPASIGILSTTDLQANNSTDIAVAMNRIPGIYMQTSGITTNRITVRGIGARTPYGTNKIRAFYGNIPLTSGNSETTIEDIDLENISQVEVIKGPLSSVYGAGLGGAILLKPMLFRQSGNTAAISTVHGSYGLMKNTLTYASNRRSSSFNISYHKLETDGWRENSAYNREGITVAGDALRKENSRLTYFFNHTHLKAFIPSSIDKTTFENNPKAGAPTWVAAKGFKEYTSVLGGLGYNFKISEHITNATSVFINYKDNNEPRPFDILRQYTFAYGARTQFSADFPVAGFPLKMNAGVEYFHDDYSGKTLENLYRQNNGLGSLEGNTLTKTNQQREFYNAFIQMRLLLSWKFEIQAGLNINTTAFELDNTFPAEDVYTNHYSYRTIASPQVSLLFQPKALQTIYLSISRGFSLPSVEETLTANGTINPAIKPENGYNLEVGGKCYWLNKKLYTEIAVYRMQINDLLVAQRVGDDQYVGINAGKTLHQGIELSLNYNFRVATLSINPFIGVSSGNYTFSKFINKDTDFSGNKLTGVPATKVNSGITLTTDSGFYLAADYQFTDKIPLNDANTIYSDSYTIINLKTGYRFKLFPGFTSHIATGVNNAANEKYASMVLVNATALGNATPRYYYPGLPVNYYATVSFNYLF